VSIASCVDIMRRRRSVHPQPQPPTKQQAISSYRDETRGKEGTQAFRILTASSSTPIVERALPASDLSFGGWSSVLHDPTPRWNPSRARKEPTDLTRVGAPSTLTPGPRVGWFLSAEGARISAERELKDFEESAERVDAHSRAPREKELRYDTHPAPSIRRPSSITDMENALPDVRLEIFPTMKRKPNDLAAFARKKLRQLTGEKEAEQLAEVATWNAQNLSQREMSERTGLTRRQVRTRLMHLSKLISATPSTT